MKMPFTNLWWNSSVAPTPIGFTRVKGSKQKQTKKKMDEGQFFKN